MPHRIYNHPCCPNPPWLKPGHLNCPHCGTPGIPAGWDFSVVEHWCRFARTYAIQPLGPAVGLARKLLDPYRTRCEVCSGSGYVGWETRRRCPECDGGGGFWTGSEEELRAAYQEVLRQYPDAATRGALYGYRPLKGQEVQDDD